MRRAWLVLLVLALLLARPAQGQSSCEIRLFWDPNTETDLNGYVLHWGTASGVYSQTTTIVKTAVTHAVTLAPGTYYFALRAFNVAGLYSGYSNEVRVVHSCTAGVPRPPVKITGIVVFVIR